MTTTPDRSLDERLDQAEAALAEALAERSALWEQLTRRKADEAELEYYRAEMEKVDQSKVWRAWKRVQRMRRYARTGLARVRGLRAGK